MVQKLTKLQLRSKSFFLFQVFREKFHYRPQRRVDFTIPEEVQIHLPTSKYSATAEDIDEAESPIFVRETSLCSQLEERAEQERTGGNLLEDRFTKSSDVEDEDLDVSPDERGQRSPDVGQRSEDGGQKASKYEDIGEKSSLSQKSSLDIKARRYGAAAETGSETSTPGQVRVKSAAGRRKPIQFSSASRVDVGASPNKELHSQAEGAVDAVDDDGEEGESAAAAIDDEEDEEEAARLGSKKGGSEKKLFGLDAALAMGTDPIGKASSRAIIRKKYGSEAVKPVTMETETGVAPLVKDNIDSGIPLELPQIDVPEDAIIIPTGQTAEGKVVIKIEEKKIEETKKEEEIDNEDFLPLHDSVDLSASFSERGQFLCPSPELGALGRPTTPGSLISVLSSKLTPDWLSSETSQQSWNAGSRPLGVVPGVMDGTHRPPSGLSMVGSRRASSALGRIKGDHTGAALAPETYGLPKHEARSYHPLQRPATSVDVRKGRKDLYDHDRVRRPCTAQPTTEGNPEDLEEEFERALARFRSKPGSPIDVNKWHVNNGKAFGDNWQERMIERHSLLKMQKQMRVQSAAQKRSLLELRQSQKRRALLGHSTRHDKEDLSRSDTALQQRPGSRGRMSADRPQHRSSPRVASAPLQRSTPLAEADQGQFKQAPSRPKTAFAKYKEENELGLDRPFRLKIKKDDSGSSQKSEKERRKKEKADGLDAKMMDPRNPASHPFRSQASKSIPSKCNRYILVSQKQDAEQDIIPTPLEEQLIPERFPNFSRRWLGEQSHWYRHSLLPVTDQAQRRTLEKT